MVTIDKLANAKVTVCEKNLFTMTGVGEGSAISDHVYDKQAMS